MKAGWLLCGTPAVGGSSQDGHRGPYSSSNHNYAVANMYVHEKFDGYVQPTFLGKWPPK